MPEQISQWAEPESHPQIPIIESEKQRLDLVKKRYFEAQEEIEKIKMDKKVEKVVHASFFDITGNLLQPLSMGMDVYEHTKNPDLLQLFESNLNYLDKYLALLASDSTIRTMELSYSDGAFPEVRHAAAQAKELGQGAIYTYIDMITGNASDGQRVN
jgi:hypothetical protein